MAPARWASSSRQVWPGFLLPPLAVVVVGCCLSVFWIRASGMEMVTATATPSVGQEEKPSPLAPLFTPEVQYWTPFILDWAERTGLSPNLIATVMQIESCGDPLARSPAGALGLFQVMPYHFEAGENPYDPDTNARRGLAYLQRSLQVSGGIIPLALAGYNGGIGVIGQGELAWSSETRRYVYWAKGIYVDADRGATGSARLQEWLAAGGASLCLQARQRLRWDRSE